MALVGKAAGQIQRSYITRTCEMSRFIKLSVFIGKLERIAILVSGSDTTIRAIKYIN
jgi:hypothetical protein